jgi:hypothetical protein
VNWTLNLGIVTAGIVVCTFIFTVGACTTRQYEACVKAKAELSINRPETAAALICRQSQ